MANRIFDLQETKGKFQVKGLVSGVDSSKFYTSKTTRTNKDFRNVNFGCMYDDKKTIFLNLNGMPQQNVYFSRKDKNTGKNETKPVPWANRNKFKEDGWNMIGVRLGLTKTTDKDGNSVNLQKTLAPFDACEYIKENLKDDSSVFIKGNLDFSSYMNDKGEVRRMIKYIPNQVSLCKEVNFEAFDGDKNKPMHDFEQNIIFMSIDKEKDENECATGRFVVGAKIVTYDDIVDAEFIVVNAKLAANLKKTVKPYSAINVHGKIEVSHSVQEAEDDSGWGDANPLKAVASSSKIELIITGADKDSIDADSYTEKSVTEAIKKIRAAKDANNKFVANDNDNDDADWGDESTDVVEDDDTPW